MAIKVNNRLFPKESKEKWINKYNKIKNKKNNSLKVNGYISRW